MAPPVSSALRVLFGAFIALSIGESVSATTFPLPIPTRPTTFPLSRPSAVGEIVAWGRNEMGQINVPFGLTNVVAVSAGSYFTLVLRNDGTVAAWGGTGATNVPVGLSGVVAMSAGLTHAAALKADGTVVCWGENGPQINVPPGLSGVVSIAAGQSQTVALKADGTIRAWGSTNFSIPLWINYDGLEPRPPTNVVSVSAGNVGIRAILSDGRVAVWPDTYTFYGTLRVNTANAFDVSEVASITSNYILRRDGILNSSYYLMNSMPLNVRPVAISGESDFALALNADGSVTVWGYDPEVITNTPPRLRSVIGIAAGYGHAVVLKTPTPPVPTTARAQPVIVNGFLVGLNLIDGGEGYAVPPQVTISGGGGSAATATAQISKGVVTGFTITNAGIGYTSTPTVTIEPPPFLPKLTIATSRVGVTMQVVPGKRYQLESSNDLPNFGPVGAPFVADKDTIAQEFTVSETGQFFRIVEVP